MFEINELTVLMAIFLALKSKKITILEKIKRPERKTSQSLRRIFVYNSKNIPRWLAATI